MSVTDFFNLILRHLKIQKKGVKARNPFRDWEFILSVSAILLVVLFAAGAFLYYEIYTGQLFSPGTTTAFSHPPLNRGAFDATADFYAERAQKLQALEGGTTPIGASSTEATSTAVVDPSTNG